MHGTPPTAPIPTPAQVRSAIDKHLPILPRVISDLTSQYVCNMAERPLRFGDSGLIKCDENDEIQSAIQKVLTTPGYDPYLKAEIFHNFERHRPTSSAHSDLLMYSGALNAIFNMVRASGQRINLDSVQFGKQNLLGLNLSGASLVGSKFKDTSFTTSSLVNADLTDADFQHVRFAGSDCSNALFVRSTFSKSTFEICIISGSDIKGAKFRDTNFIYVIATGINYEDTRLTKVLAASEIDGVHFFKNTMMSQPAMFLRCFPRLKEFQTLPAGSPESRIIILNTNYNAKGEPAMPSIKIEALY